jgi:hypothetical protein
VDRSTVDAALDAVLDAALDASVSHDASPDAPPVAAGSFRDPYVEIDARWSVRSGEGGAAEPVLDVIITNISPGRLGYRAAPWRLSLEGNLDGDAGAVLIDARAVREREDAALEMTAQTARFLLPLGALKGPLRLVVRVPLCLPHSCVAPLATLPLQAPPPWMLP